MLTQEDNDLLTRTGPGTPCGELMRRYWQPAALSEELPPDGAPLPIRLLGEDLVLFRVPSSEFRVPRSPDGPPSSTRNSEPATRNSELGLLGIHCSHRGADLSYGRLEDGGLRCIYHGWLYDRHGRCLEQPGEPAGRSFHERIHHPAYPCREVEGVIYAYMGPGEPPELPPFEFIRAPIEYRQNAKVMQECNYLQANEGNQDPVHLSFLHQMKTDNPESAQALNAYCRSPIMEVEETDFGVRIYCVRRTPDGRNYVRVTNYILPNLCAVTGTADGYQVLWHVPIDDTHHWRYMIRFSRTRPIARDSRVAGQAGSITADYRCVRNRSNRYLQDRESMQTWSYTGLGRDFLPHDVCATETAGEIQDRTQEYLGYTDKGIVASRLRLLRVIRDLQAGREPPGVVHDSTVRWEPDVVARSDALLPPSVDWHGYWRDEALLKEMATVPPG